MSKPTLVQVATDNELLSLMSHRMSQYFMFRVLEVLSQKYYDGKLYALGITVASDMIDAVVDRVVAVDEDGKPLKSKQLSPIEAKQFASEHFPWITYGIDASNAFEFISDFLIEHYEIKYSIFNSVPKIKVFYNEDDGSFDDAPVLADAGKYYYSEGKKRDKATPGNSKADRVDLVKQIVAADGISKELSRLSKKD